jgi:hypothetical protein
VKEGSACLEFHGPLSSSRIFINAIISVPCTEGEIGFSNARASRELVKARRVNRGKFFPPEGTKAYSDGEEFI